MIKDVIVVRDRKVVNVIVVEDGENIDPKKHGGDYFLDDQAERPSIGWSYVKTSKTFTNPSPRSGIATEKIINGSREIVVE